MWLRDASPSPSRWWFGMAAAARPGRCVCWQSPDPENLPGGFRVGSAELSWWYRGEGQSRYLGGSCMADLGRSQLMKYMDQYEAQYRNCVWLDFEYLERFMFDALVAAGVPKEDARIVSDVLIE